MEIPFAPCEMASPRLWRSQGIVVQNAPLCSNEARLLVYRTSFSAQCVYPDPRTGKTSHARSHNFCNYFCMRRRSFSGDPCRPPLSYKHLHGHRSTLPVHTGDSRGRLSPPPDRLRSFWNTLVITAPLHPLPPLSVRALLLAKLNALEVSVSARSERALQKESLCIIQRQSHRRHRSGARPPPLTLAMSCRPCFSRRRCTPLVGAHGAPRRLPLCHPLHFPSWFIYSNDVFYRWLSLLHLYCRIAKDFSHRTYR